MMYRSPVSDHLGSRANLPHPGYIERKRGIRGLDSLRSLIDEAELAQEADKACILELSHEFTFQPVDSAAENTVSITNCVFPDQYSYSLLRFV